MKGIISRRDFIKSAGQGLLGGIVVLSIPSLLQHLVPREDATGSVPSANPGQYDWEKHYWGFVCDTERCIGCGRCVVACKLENNVPWQPEYTRTWVERYVNGEDGEIHMDSPRAGRDGFEAEYINGGHRNLEVSKSFFVPKLCNQCDEPPCVRVCPTRASYLTKDGVVLIDRQRCIGCKYCMVACPYRARFLDPRLKVVDKCNWCYHRIAKGLLPACVEACPVGARLFGDLRDPESPVRKMLREKRVYVLKPTLGTKPKVYYIGLDKGVR